MTPQEEALNNQIRTLPVIIELKENDDEIKEGLDGLKENDNLIMEKLGALEIGQSETEERLDAGADQFKLLWSKVNEMGNSIDKLSDTFTEGIDKLSKEIFNSKLDDAISKNTNMVQENQELKNKLEKQESKAWDVKKIVLASVLSLIIGGLGVYLFK